MSIFECYEQAEKFLPRNVDSLVLNEDVDVNWIEGSNRFWYRCERPEGKEFIHVDAELDTRSPAFDHERLASALAEETRETYEAEELPFDSFEYTDDESAIQFCTTDARFECDLSAYECEEIAEKGEPEAGESPDGRWIAFTDDHNLYVRSTENREVLQLTTDGEEHYDYATPLPSPVDMIDTDGQNSLICSILCPYDSS
jgi:dipeptidyl-peptidase-4